MKEMEPIKESTLRLVATVVEQVIIRGGPELNPLMIATAAIQAYRRAEKIDGDPTSFGL